MKDYPKPLQNLISHFCNFPGIGQKTAERLVLFLLNLPTADLEKFGKDIKNIKNQIIRCGVCNNISETDPCDICRDSKRDGKLLCVVAKPQDVISIEKTNNFQGKYHILGGNYNPLEGINMEDLKTKELLFRITKDQIDEIILAFSPDIEGETTSMALIKILKPLNVKITRLARGLPMGSDLEYADEITLANAIKERKEI